MSDTAFDIAIIGSGAAGLQAAIHAARRKHSVVVLGRAHRSNAVRGHMENYFAVENMGGKEMVDVGVAQARKFGATVREEDVTALAPDEEGRFRLTLESRDAVIATAVVIATGISLERLGVPGEKELIGRGVSYCVDCDANFFRQQTVAVVGNGSAAVEGALTLLAYATEVQLACATLDVDSSLRSRLESSAVKVHADSTVKMIRGEGTVQGLVLEGGQDITVDGVFVELGSKGVMELTIDLGVELDAESFKYIVTDKQQKTNVPGVFAAGDVCGGRKQIAKAVGEGCVAGLSASAFVREKTKASAP